MATTSQVRSVINDLYDLLVVREGLEGVPVFRYAASPRDIESASEYLVIATRVTTAQDNPLLTARIKDENFTLYGAIYVEKPGAGDAVADATQERAEELLAEIQAELFTDISLGRTETTVKLTDTEHVYGASEDDRLHSLTFQIECWTRLNAT